MTALPQYSLLITLSAESAVWLILFTVALNHLSSNTPNRCSTTSMIHFDSESHSTFINGDLCILFALQPHVQSLLPVQRHGNLLFISWLLVCTADVGASVHTVHPRSVSAAWEECHCE